MEPQYHFWRSADGEGTARWSVDRLIELSSSLPVVAVLLADIAEVDSVYWFDGDRYRPTVRSVVEHTRRIADVDMRHPVILGPDGRVMDGMHRIARALLEGRVTVEARVFDELHEPDDIVPGD